MEKMTLVFGGMMIFMGSIFIAVVLGPLLGAFAGWVVGLVFGETILGIAAQLGIKDVEMWQLGAFLGFVSGFLKTKATVDVERK